MFHFGINIKCMCTKKLQEQMLLAFSKFKII